MIFVNLPVGDLNASMAFYKAIGFENNPHFTDETAACMVWSEAIYVMLLTHAKWRTFTSRPIPPASSSEVMLALACDNREAVDAMNQAAAASGGQSDINPVQDLGFMYSRDFLDPDGHAWGPFWMDPAAIPSGDSVG
jgi:predicted lactoylglutathione lyase